MRLRGRPMLAGATLAAALWAGHAGAQSDPVAARVLFGEARTLASQAKYEQACPKFEESQRLDPGIGTLFNLADCWEHLGRTASAWGRFLDVAAQAKLAGQPDREKVARDRAALLEPKLSRLTIEVTSKDTGLEVRRDDVATGAAIWGSAMPVDPGSHSIEANAPHKKKWQQTVQVGTNAAKVTVTVPPLEEDGASTALGTASPPSVAAHSSSDGSAVVASPNAAADVSSTSSGNKTLGFVLLGAGAAGVAVGTIFGLQAKSKNDTALAICQSNPNTCPDPDITTHDAAVSDARGAFTLSVVGFAVGGAAIIGGVIVLASSRSSKSSVATIAIAPVASPHGSGLALSGRW